MKIIIYIEKSDFDVFFQWINRLNNGNLCHSPVPYYIEKEEAKEPLQLIVEPEFYSLIQDAESDLESIREKFGTMELEYDPTSISWELRTIADILRNSRRLDIEADVVYTALFQLRLHLVLFQVPSEQSVFVHLAQSLLRLD